MERLLPPAENDVGFRAYWTANGFTDEDVDAALEGLEPRTLALAHARIGSRMIERNRERFDTHVSALLLESGGRWHEFPRWV